MGWRLLKASPWRNLAPFCLAASLLLSWAHPAVAADPEITAAWTQHNAGESLTARRGLEAFLATGEAVANRRLTALETLAEICLRSLADACLAKAAGDYASAAGQVVAANPVQRLELGRRASYYIFAAQLARGTPQQVDAILRHDIWASEHAYDVELYLRRQVLAANVLIRQGKPLEANRAIDKVLSLIAAVKNPRDGTPTLVWALSETMENLAILGDTERAYGVYKAIVGAIGQVTPPQSVEAALFQLRAGILLGEMGQVDPARKFLDLAVRTIDAIELEASAREHLLMRGLTELASLCALQGDAACARAALDRHPFAARYARPGRAPASFEEVRYLTVRAMAGGAAQTADPVAAAALTSPLGFSPDEADGEIVAALRDIGAALASPPGQQRSARLSDAGRKIQIVARRKTQAPFGAWYRSSAFDRGLFAVALTQAARDGGDAGADVVFTLMQLANRSGRSFDADALTALGQAGGETERRSIHQALRLRARRDALERAALGAVAAQMIDQPASGGRMQQDVSRRMRFRDFANRIAAASEGLDGVVTSGTNLVTLRQAQAALKPDEAMLTIAPAAGGLVYMCVRRDSGFRRGAATDLRPLVGDFKLIAAALSAGHAPDEALDAQFPVASAVRLYDVLIRPFAPCLKPGDHIVWLPNLAVTGFPIQALLERAPPKAAVGWDLSQAAWLARDHAVTYAGGAAAIVALRASPQRQQPAFDFLGAGDPVLIGVTAAGEDRLKLATRGARGGPGLAALAPLPETRDELLRSARGFASSTVLTGEAASESRVRGQVTGAYRYISFATHGLLRDDLQGLAEPALVLTPVSAADSMDDGLFTATEIADLNLSARFVALSACNTANFDVTQMAQDLPAMASAFAVAGVPATLGTLWPVDSETSKRVVGAIFEDLRAGHSPARALARAQRAFLAATPSQAWLHPRFWAPFVVMGDGDGGAAPAPAEPLRMTSVEMLAGDGEVYAIRRDGGRTLTHASGARARSGAYTGTTRLTGGPAWARIDSPLGATGLLADLGNRVVVGGERSLGPQRVQPALEALDSRTGKVAASWRGEAITQPVAVVLGGRRLDAAQAVFAVATLPRPQDKARPRLYVYVVDAGLKPRLLFEAESPSDRGVSAVTFSRLNGALLVTYSARAAFAYPEAPLIADDFDLPLCTQESLTRVELRDLATGALQRSADLRGGMINAAAETADGKVLLGGSRQAACAVEARAVLATVDAGLAVRQLWRDASLGASDVRTLAALADGRVFIGAAKDNTVDFGPPTPGARITDQDVARLLYSGMVLMLDRQGGVSAPAYLNAGATVLVTASDAADAGDILLGGAVGSAPAIFHLSASGDRARR